MSRTYSSKEEIKTYNAILEIEPKTSYISYISLLAFSTYRSINLRRLVH